VCLHCVCVLITQQLSLYGFFFGGIKICSNTSKRTFFDVKMNKALGMPPIGGPQRVKLQQVEFSHSFFIYKPPNHSRVLLDSILSCRSN